MAKEDRIRLRMVARGRVQGVGFRPTYLRVLTSLGCGGTISNTPEGVVLEVEGPPGTVQDFARDFRDHAPGRARVDELIVTQVAPLGQHECRILPSDPSGRSLLPIPPDLAVCSECRAELHDPACRRAGYPFNTCTDCGPRFSIARAVPFDRATSTMDDFPPCPECEGEFADRTDRRLHAQTLSCPACGPMLAFLTPAGAELDRPLERTRRMLADGAILAIKGIGGFHLACDATNEQAVALLRKRKGRPARPFAVMLPDVEHCRAVCRVSDREAELLTSEQAPIVLLRMKPRCPVAPSVAPGLRDLGVMLPYTPLHLLLFDDPAVPSILVMTSCNMSEEPISITHEQVIAHLGGVADGVLTNDRRIVNRCDDSVVAVCGGFAFPMRRSRGYAPEPVMLDEGGPSILATGGMLKNAFAITSGRRVFLSQHIGDVSDADNAAYFAESVEAFLRLLRLEPEVVACDLHPDYPTTAYARELCEARGLPLVQVQQHHTHIASCLAENGERGPVVGVSWDGTGYGEDGAVWGGEFMVADRADYERRYHLGYVAMPGGEQAVHHPWRMAAAHLARWLGEDEACRRLAPAVGSREVDLALKAAQMAQFSPPTSSAGRLFDAVSALLGIRLSATYEGQAACELEARCAEGSTGLYEFGYDGKEITLRGVFGGICADLDAGAAVAEIAARFHSTMAAAIVETCGRLREETGLQTVALSGGVMQNRTLVAEAAAGLRGSGFRVLLHSLVPPNDGGLCLGQAACALARVKRGGEG
jgi:hydrogenase maturation protein HypF